MALSRLKQGFDSPTGHLSFTAQLLAICFILYLFFFTFSFPIFNILLAIRRHSQVAKALDCNSTIPGSNPGVAFDQSVCTSSRLFLFSAFIKAISMCEPDCPPLPSLLYTPLLFCRIRSRRCFPCRHPCHSLSPPQLFLVRCIPHNRRI